MRTVKIPFNFGKFGKVTWEAPRDMFPAHLTNSDILEIVKVFLEPPVFVFFGLLGGFIKGGPDFMEEHAFQLHNDLLAMAKRLARGQK